MGARVARAFTRVFDALCPRMTTQQQIAIGLRVIFSKNRVGITRYCFFCRTFRSGCDLLASASRATSSLGVA
jgi:hypothetical protein